MPFSSCGFLWIVPQQSDRCTPQVERRQQLLADCPIRQQNPLAGSPNTSACITMSESRRAASSKVRQPPCRLQTGVKPDCVFFKIEHTFNRKKKMRTYFANTVLFFQLNKYTVLFLVSVQSPIFWSHFTLKGPQVNFQVHTLNLVAYQIMLTGSPVQKMHYFSHTVHCRCTSIHPLSEHSGLIPVSLRPASRKAHSALIGQHSKAWTGTAHRVSASALLFLFFFCNVGRAGDCILVTSQP